MTSSTILKKRGEIGHPCLVSSLWGSLVFPTEYVAGAGLSKMAFIVLLFSMFPQFSL